MLKGEAPIDKEELFERLERFGIAADMKNETLTAAGVVHGLPTRREVRELLSWLEQDNQGLKISGARWLLNEQRRQGKTHSSLVIHLRTPTNFPSLGVRTRHKQLRTTGYNWDA